MFKIKRAYQDPEDEDGYRILVDRLWPRGVSKDKAKFDLWMKEIAPSNELRKWFGHEHGKWVEFKNKYIAELSEKQELIKQLFDLEKINKIVTMIYAAKDEKQNNAVVLLEFLGKSLKTEL
jgi:uncharacterized protein YeaO (DUF488 family)